MMMKWNNDFVTNYSHLAKICILFSFLEITYRSGVEFQIYGQDLLFRVKFQTHSFWAKYGQIENLGSYGHVTWFMWSQISFVTKTIQVIL